jgi:hypothetical protein
MIRTLMIHWMPMSQTSQTSQMNQKKLMCRKNRMIQMIQTNQTFHLLKPQGFFRQIFRHISRPASEILLPHGGQLPDHFENIPH